MNDNTTEESFDALTESQWLAMHMTADLAAGLEAYRETVREWIEAAQK